MAFTLEGIASGSRNNCFWIKQWDVLLDIGICDRNIINLNHLLLTHAHSDHSAGLIYYLSQRRLFDFPSAKIYVPFESAKNIKTAIEAWEMLENIQYHYEIIPGEENVSYPLGRNYFCQIYPVRHRIPSIAYTIFEHKQKLKPEYQKLSGAEIQILRQNKQEVTQKVIWPVLSYLGDCDFDSLLAHQNFFQSKYLILESTYIDDWHDIEHAKRWGHIHLDQILGNPNLFHQNEKIILTHFSSRYSTSYIQKTIADKCPADLKSKMIIWTTQPKLESCTYSMSL